MFQRSEVKCDGNDGLPVLPSAGAGKGVVSQWSLGQFSAGACREGGANSEVKEGLRSAEVLPGEGGNIEKGDGTDV